MAGDPIVLSARIPVELTNGNDGRGSKWFKSAKVRQQFEQQFLEWGMQRKPFGFPTIVTVTRILGPGQRLWDSSSIGRGNWKEIEDALVAIGWWHDDGPKWITETRFRQDATQRSAGPCVDVLVEHASDQRVAKKGLTIMKDVAATPLQPIVMASVPQVTLPKPYYDQGGITIYHGDCREIFPMIRADVLVSDPPYGIAYKSSMTGHNGGKALPGIVGDDDTSLRDWMLEVWQDQPAIVFGSWKRPRPNGCKALLIWEKGDHVGMGDLSIPWKPNTEEIYVFGKGFEGRRGSSVLKYNAAVTWNSVGHGRRHPHEKPIGLMRELIAKCPRGVVVDPFLGSGSTLEAARDDERQGIGIEIDEKHCETAAKRFDQGVLF